MATSLVQRLRPARHARPLPPLWRGPHADPADARALAELAAYNLSADGTITPRSINRGFETYSFGQYSFGQKKSPSPSATALLLAVLHRLDDLAATAATVDIQALPSSKSGTGTAVPP